MKLETGNWKLEIGNWKLETGNWKHTPNQKEGVKSLATAPAALGVRECKCVVCWYVAGCWWAPAALGCEEMYVLVWLMWLMWLMRDRLHADSTPITRRRWRSNHHNQQLLVVWKCLSWCDWCGWWAPAALVVKKCWWVQEWQMLVWQE